MAARKSQDNPLANLDPAMLAAIAALVQGTQGDDSEEETPKSRSASTRAKANRIELPTATVKVGDWQYAFTVALESRNRQGEVTTTYRTPRIKIDQRGPGMDDFAKVGTVSQPVFEAIRALSDAKSDALVGFEMPDAS